MIAFVEGNIVQVDPAQVVIDTGGVGYAARISLQTYALIKDLDRTRLFTYVQVREDAHVLYGFADTLERELFELLISVSGVGGNTALMILSSLSPSELAQAFQKQDANALKRIKGIGAKTAERLILELRDKIGAGFAALAGPKSVSDNMREEALAALVQLGMPRPAMVARLEKIFQENAEPLSVAEVIKLALRNP